MKHPLINYLLSGCVASISEVVFSKELNLALDSGDSRLDLAMRLTKSASVSRCGICGMWDKESNLIDESGMVSCSHVSTWEQQAEWVRLHDYDFAIGAYFDPKIRGKWKVIDNPKYEAAGTNPKDKTITYFYGETIPEVVENIFTYYWSIYQDTNN